MNVLVNVYGYCHLRGEFHYVDHNVEFNEYLLGRTFSCFAEFISRLREFEAVCFFAILLLEGYVCYVRNSVQLPVLSGQFPYGSQSSVCSVSVLS
jgi:hypothetical protein